MDLQCFQTSVNEAAIPGIYKLRGNTHTQTWTDYYNPPPTLRLQSTTLLYYSSYEIGHNNNRMVQIIVFESVII